MLNPKLTIIKEDLKIWFPFCTFNVNRLKDNSSKFKVIIRSAPIVKMKDSCYYESNTVASKDYFEKEAFCYLHPTKAQNADVYALMRGFHTFCKQHPHVHFAWTQNYTQIDTPKWKTVLAHTLLKEYEPS